MSRRDGRSPDELRKLAVTRRYTRAAAGSVLIQAGRTSVLCTASLEKSVSPWRLGSGEGWITAEYSMLPGSTSPRKPRDTGGKVDGRTVEIQRLIGRSLRSVADLAALGERQISVDCDVLEADGGTRTLSITGALIALVDAILTIPGLERFPLRDSVAAVSVGMVTAGAEGAPAVPLLDLDYSEDVRAAVDMNVVLTGKGQFVEVQGTGEESTFDEGELAQMLALSRGGIAQLTQFQRDALGADWPF